MPGVTAKCSALLCYALCQSEKNFFVIVGVAVHIVYFRVFFDLQVKQNDIDECVCIQNDAKSMRNAHTFYIYFYSQQMHCPKTSDPR